MELQNIFFNRFSWHRTWNIGKQERPMRGYLINKNLCLYDWLRPLKVGKKWKVYES
jgi:hypothetical protein